MSTRRHLGRGAALCFTRAATPLATVALIPGFRPLQAVPGADASMVAYADGHSFQASREALATEIRAWLARTMSAPRSPQVPMAHGPVHVVPLRLAATLAVACSGPEPL